MKRLLNYFVFLVLCPIYGSAEEPVSWCSPMQNLEHLLEKLVRMEIKLEQVEKQQNAYHNFSEKMLQMDIKIEKLQKIFEQNFTTGEAKLCAQGWIQHLNSCYLFWDTHTLNFQDAAVMCRRFGAHLVFVDTEAENTFIQQTLRTLQSANWWIGITDEVTEGTWKCYGTDKMSSFTDWIQNPRQPDGGRNENCGQFLSGSYNFKWNDIPCGTAMYTVCEK